MRKERRRQIAKSGNLRRNSTQSNWRSGKELAIPQKRWIHASVVHRAFHPPTQQQQEEQQQEQQQLRKMPINQQFWKVYANCFNEPMKLECVCLFVCVSACMTHKNTYVITIYINYFIYGVCVLLFLRFYQQTSREKCFQMRAGLVAWLPVCLVWSCCHVLPASQARVYKYNYALAALLSSKGYTPLAPHRTHAVCKLW